MNLATSLPRGWKRVKVQDVAKKEKGSTVTGPFGSNIGRKFFVDHGVPLIRGNNLTKGIERFIDDGFVFITEKKADELKRCEAIPDDLVFTAAGTLGQIGIIPKDCKYPRYIISNKQMRLRCDGNLASPLYLYYWFISPYMIQFIENQSTGASIPLINLGILRSLPINLPPLMIQRTITTILSAYDDLIENNRRRIQLLEEMARALYREWFVHFRFPGHEEVEMVDSELGEIPEGWNVCLVKDILDRLNKGEVYTEKDVHRDGNIPVIDQSRDRTLGFHNNIPDFPASSAKPLAVFGDHTCKFQLLTIPFSIGPNVIPFNTHIDHSLYYIFSVVDGIVETREYKRHWNVLLSKKVIMATPNLSQKYAEIVQPAFEEISKLEKINRRTQIMKDLLLPKLVSGQIDVSDLNIEIPPDTHKTSKYSDQPTLEQWLDGDDEHDPS